MCAAYPLSLHGSFVVVAGAPSLRFLAMTASSMPGLAAVPHTSTHALANATLPYTLSIANQGWQKEVQANHAVAEGVNVADGRVVDKPVDDAHGMEFTPLATLLDSRRPVRCGAPSGTVTLQVRRRASAMVRSEGT